VVIPSSKVFYLWEFHLESFVHFPKAAVSPEDCPRFIHYSDLKRERKILSTRLIQLTQQWRRDMDLSDMYTRPEAATPLMLDLERYLTRDAYLDFKLKVLIFPLPSENVARNANFNRVL
jgi:hypothetical protein